MRFSHFLFSYALKRFPYYVGLYKAPKFGFIYQSYSWVTSSVFILIVCFSYFLWNYCFASWVNSVILFAKKAIYFLLINMLLKCFPLNQDLNSSHSLPNVIFRYFSSLFIYMPIIIFLNEYLKKMCSISLTIAVFYITIKSTVFIVLPKFSASLWLFAPAGLPVFERNM